MANASGGGGGGGAFGNGAGGAGYMPRAPAAFGGAGYAQPEPSQQIMVRNVRDFLSSPGASVGSYRIVFAAALVDGERGSRGTV